MSGSTGPSGWPRAEALAAPHHIGTLAHSAEGATLCYRTAWMEGVRRMGPPLRPAITVTGIVMHLAIEARDSEFYGIAPA